MCEDNINSKPVLDSYQQYVVLESYRQYVVLDNSIRITGDLEGEITSLVHAMYLETDNGIKSILPLLLTLSNMTVQTRSLYFILSHLAWPGITWRRIGF